MSETKALKLVMPKDDVKGTPVAQSGAVTILPDSDRIYYYRGEWSNKPGAVTGIGYAE